MTRLVKMAATTIALSCALSCALATAARGEQPRLPAMVDIPAGRFVMGAPADADAQQGKPEHEVNLRAFRLGRTEVTFAQYDAFARATARPLPNDDGLGRGDNPVVNVNRTDMLAYIAWLNATSGQQGYRLPTEAEWEYAARAGTTTPYYWGDKPDSAYANVAGMPGPDRWEFLAPVASLRPNAWGLFDMSGNVWEMTADCLSPDYRAAPTDGSAYRQADCPAYMLRGGDYGSKQRGQKSTARGAVGAEFRSMSIGFRVAQDLPAK